MNATLYPKDNNRPVSDFDALREAYFSLFDQQGHPAIALRTDADAPAVPTGGSKLGGRPDVPEDFVWPYFPEEGGPGSTPLSFLAQINLAEAAPLDVNHELPPSGLLCFFYEFDEQPWGCDPEDRGSGRVFYIPEGVPLRRADFPEDLPPSDSCRIPERALRLSALMLPDDEPGTAAFRPFIKLCQGDSRLAWTHYMAFRREYIENAGAQPYGSFLLGIPDLIQGPMEGDLESYAYDSGLFDDDTEEDWHEDETCGRWRLLFQLGDLEDRKGRIHLADCGQLYFWIRCRELAARDFSKVWTLVQSY